MRYLFGSIFFFTCLTIFPQDFIQIGQDIDGESAGDWCGFSVSLTSDGHTVAIGAYINNGNGENSGQVRVFKLIGSNWSQVVMTLMVSLLMTTVEQVLV